MFKIGDKVVLNPKKEPAHGWGGVSRGTIGTIVDVHEGVSKAYIVEFPTHGFWLGEETDLTHYHKDNYFTAKGKLKV